jgi:hypothetical protein
MNIPVPVEWLLIFWITNQVLSALVQALPPPNGNPWYTFFYKFMNLLTADFKSFAAQIPQPVLTQAVSTGAIETITTAQPTATNPNK